MDQAVTSSDTARAWALERCTLLQAETVIVEGTSVTFTKLEAISALELVPLLVEAYKAGEMAAVAELKEAGGISGQEWQGLERRTGSRSVPE